MMDIHPDDILTFKEVTEAMRRVALKYDLPLQSISGYPMPLAGMADRLGDCSHTGHIRLVLRCTVNGEWCEEPINPNQVWDTAAHELAHLRHFNHGQAFQDFCEELEQAMGNQKVDHRQKVLDRLVKLQKSRQSEAELGNSEAAEAFARAINKMMLEYELSPSDIDYARATDHDPVIEIPLQFDYYHIERSKVRVAWQETLAMAVANAHLCKLLIRPRSNEIHFVGTRSHATVAEYVYGTLVPVIGRMSKQAEVAYWRETGSGRGRDNKALGYRSAWIGGFINRLYERFQESRRAALANAPVSSETGLMRLEGALIKAQQYIDDKFSGRRAARTVASLRNRARSNEAGREAGRQAANQIPIGRRGVDAGTPPKLLDK